MRLPGMSYIRKFFSDSGPRPTMDKEIAEHREAIAASADVTRQVKSWAKDVERDTTQVLKLIDRHWSPKGKHE